MSGNRQKLRSKETARPSDDPAIMPVFCPTHQAAAAVAFDAEQAIEITGPVYCAWGCFSIFFVLLFLLPLWEKVARSAG